MWVIVSSGRSRVPTRFATRGGLPTGVVSGLSREPAPLLLTSERHAPACPPTPSSSHAYWDACSGSSYWFWAAWTTPTAAGGQPATAPSAGIGLSAARPPAAEHARHAPRARSCPPRRAARRCTQFVATDCTFLRGEPARAGSNRDLTWAGSSEGPHATGGSAVTRLTRAAPAAGKRGTARCACRTFAIFSRRGSPRPPKNRRVRDASLPGRVASG
jgi:hypothetical protein